MSKIIKIKSFIKNNCKYIICILIILLSILSIFLQQLDRKNSLILNSEEIEKKPGKIVVYITGQVKNPGVYYLDTDARLFNLIDLCGGLLDDADMDKVNLADKLTDAQKINIEKVKEQNIESEDEEYYEAQDYEDEKININTASQQELMNLNGIGKSTAQKILDYRKNKEFNSIEEIMNVPGIGTAKFESIKDYICVK